MKLKMIYGALALLGAALPLSQFLPWVVEHGLNIPLFVGELFASPISSFFGLDVIVSAVVTSFLITSEGRRSAVPKIWIPLVGTFTVGVSFGLPLFLAMREHARKSSAS